LILVKPIRPTQEVGVADECLPVVRRSAVGTHETLSSAPVDHYFHVSWLFEANGHPLRLNRHELSCNGNVLAVVRVAQKRFTGQSQWDEIADDARRFACGHATKRKQNAAEPAAAALRKLDPQLLKAAAAQTRLNRRCLGLRRPQSTTKHRNSSMTIKVTHVGPACVV
jgi:hypothetical protein